MKVIYGIRQAKKFNKPVVALGVFDGIHLAHRRILKAAVRKARSIKGTSLVLTFFPHPQKEDSLSSLEHRLRLIGDLGIDVCVVIRFDKRFSKISAERFIKDILIDKIRVSYLYVGENFRFGRNAQGDYKLLKELSRKYNFSLRIFGIMRISNRSISSSYIRRLISKGEFSKAEEMFLRPVSVLGTVIRGSSLARKLGFPTANIDPHHEILPPAGIYTVWVIYNRKRYKGICYIGTKPTLMGKRAIGMDKRKKINVEVYIFGFNRSIYGKNLEIQFIDKLRKELKFTSLSFLAEQIKKDISCAKEAFSRLH